MKEQWEWIEGFEGKYAISNLGRIKSYAIYSNGKLLNPRHDKDGYLHIGLSMGARGLSKDVRIHRMVAEAFIPNPNNYPILMINHWIIIWIWDKCLCYHSMDSHIFT